MLGDMIALFNARKDFTLAKRIASDMVVNNTIDRASWPIAIAKFWMGIGLIALSFLAALFLWLGIMTHWALAIPAILFIGAGYLIIRLWRGLNTGLQTVRKIALTEVGKRMDAIQLPMNATEKPET